MSTSQSTLSSHHPLQDLVDQDQPLPLESAMGSESGSGSSPIHRDSKPIDFQGRSDKAKGKQRQLSQRDGDGNGINNPQSQSINNQSSNHYESDSFTPPNPSSPLAIFGSFTSTPPTGRLSLDDPGNSNFNFSPQNHKRNQLSQSSSLFNPLQEEEGDLEFVGGQSFEDSDYFNHSSSLATTAATSYSLSPPRILSFSGKGKGKGKEIERLQEVERDGEVQTEVIDRGGNQGLSSQIHQDEVDSSTSVRDSNQVEISRDPKDQVLEDSASPIDSTTTSESGRGRHLSSSSSTTSPQHQHHALREASLPPQYPEEVHERNISNASSIPPIPLDYAQALADEAAWRRTLSTSSNVRNRNDPFFGSLGELPPYANEETRLPGYQTPPPSTINPNHERRRFFGGNGSGSGSRFSPSVFLRRMRTSSLANTTSTSSADQGGASNGASNMTSTPSVIAGLPSSSSTSANPFTFPPISNDVVTSNSTTSSMRRPFCRADSAPGGLATLSRIQRDHFIMGPRLNPTSHHSGINNNMRRHSVVNEVSNQPSTVPARIETEEEEEEIVASHQHRQGRRSSLFSNFKERVRNSRGSSLVNPNSTSTSANQSPAVSRPASVRSGSHRPSSSASWSINGSLMTNGSRPTTNTRPSQSAFRFPSSSVVTGSPSLPNSRPTSSQGRPSLLKHHVKTFSLRNVSDLFGHSGSSSPNGSGSGRRDRRVSTSSVPVELGSARDVISHSNSGSTASSSGLQSSAMNRGSSEIGRNEETSSSSNGRENNNGLTIQHQSRLSTVYPSPDLRPQPSSGNLDLDSTFQLNPNISPQSSRSNGRRSPNVSSNLGGERPSLLRKGYSAPLASTSFTLGEGLQSTNSHIDVVKRDLFDLILPREMRIHIFAELVRIHEDDFEDLLENDEYRGRVARENVWVGKEKGIRELVRISRVSRTFQSLVLDGQLWQEMDISEFPAISERALVSIARSAGPFVKDLNLTGLSNLPSSALIALTQAHSGEVTLSDPINRQPLSGGSNQVGSSSITFPSTSRSQSVGQLDLVTLNSNNLLGSNDNVTRLTSLKLKGCSSISRDALHHLLERSPNLTILSLSDLSIVNDQTLELISEKNLKLEVLDVSRCHNISGDGVAKLGSSLKEMRKLRAVGLDEVNDLMMSSISEGMTKLEILNLSYSDITDSHLESFVSTTSEEESDSVIELTPREAGGDLSSTSMCYKNRLNLKHLALSACRRVTDRGLIHLAHSVPKLEVLELANVGVNLTDRGLCKLIETIPLIKRLDLEGATEITEVTVEALTPPASFSEMLGLNLSSSDNPRNRRSFLSSIRNGSNNLNVNPPIASTSNTTATLPSIPGSQLTHLILSHCTRIEPDSIATLIQRAPFLRHLHLDDTRCGDEIVRDFVKILKEREIQNGFISLIDCRSITRSTCNELNQGGNVRPRNGRRGYEFNSYHYDDVDLSQDASASNRNGGLDECNPNKVVFKSFWSWQNVDNRMKIIRKKELKLLKKGKGRLRSLSNGNGNGQQDDDETEERGRWNRLTSVITFDEDDDARNCRIM